MAQVFLNVYIHTGRVGIVLTVKKIDETHFKSDFITYTDFHSAFCAAA